MKWLVFAVACALAWPAAARAEGPRPPYDVSARVQVPWKQLAVADRANRAGLADHGKKRYKQAAAHFERAIAADANAVYARYNAACAYARLGDHDRALALLEQLRALDGSAARTLLRKARTDPDLAALHADPRLLAASDVPAPAAPPAYSLDRLYGDRFDGFCAWFAEAGVNPPEGAPGCVWREVVDCRSGKRLERKALVAMADDQDCLGISAKLRASRQADAERWAADLGLAPWAPASDAQRAQAQAWFRDHLAAKVSRAHGHNKLVDVVIAPSGAWVALRHGHLDRVIDDLSSWAWTVAPAADVLGAR